MEKIISQESFWVYHDDHIQIVGFIKTQNPEKSRKAIVDNLKRGFGGLV